MKNRGFTLVELLVTVVVLGIIMGLSFPVIRHIQEENNRKKYETYAEGMMTSARLYVDSYDKDLFGHHDTGCAYITYQELVERNLLKEIPISDVTCHHENSFIRVVKLKNQYAYAYSLECRGKTSREVTYSYPEGEYHQMNTNMCKGREGSSIGIDFTTSSSYARRKKVKVLLSSFTGIHGDIVMYSTWVKGKDNRPSDDAEWSRVNFQVPSKQEELILEGNTIEVESEEIISDSKKQDNGSYYLWIRVDGLKDIYGESWKNPHEEEYGNYVQSGEFKVDNTPPLCTLEGTSNVWTTGSRTIEWGCKDVGEGASGCRKPNDEFGEMNERYGTYTFPNNKEKAKSRNMFTREEYVITDVAGNKTTCPTASVSIKIDNDDPICEQTGSSTVWTNKNRTIKWGCRDNESGCAIGWSGGETTFSTTTKQADIPAYTIRDNVGHEVKCPKEKNTNIYVDKIAPVCTNRGDDTTWTTGNRNIIWGCSDSDSGCDPKASGGNTNFTTPTRTAVIPSYTIKDIGGNQTVCPARTANVYADQEGPKLTVGADPLSLGKQDYTFTSNVTIRPGISGIKTALACTPETSKKTGSYKVSCSATSIAGKTSTVTFTTRHSFTVSGDNIQDPICGTNPSSTVCRKILRYTDGSSTVQYESGACPGDGNYGPRDCWQTGGPKGEGCTHYDNRREIPGTTKTCTVYVCPSGTKHADGSTKSTTDKTCYY